MEAHECRKGLPEPAVKLIIWCAPTLALFLIGFMLQEWTWVPEQDWIDPALLVTVFGSGLVPTSVVPYLVVIGIGLMITRMIFVLRSQRKAGIKALLIAVWLIILAIVVHSTLFWPRTLHFHTKTNAQSRFEARAAVIYPENDLIPLEIETASSAEYHHYIDFEIFYESVSDILLCNYGEAEYKDALASLEDRCGFRTESMGTGRFDEDHVEITIEPYAMIGDDCFRVLFPEDGNSCPFYKECLLIMNNGVKRQIAYIILTDYDLDDAEDLTAFINEECGWRLIR